MPDERDMAARGKVSIWVGDFADEMEALDYVESDDGFGKQFGCVLRHSRELVTYEEPKPLPQLLEGFSSWKDFIGEAAALASEEVRCGRRSRRWRFGGRSTSIDSRARRSFPARHDGNMADLVNVAEQ